MSPVIAPTNSSTLHMETTIWLQQTVQQFFSSFNWEDQLPEVQELRAASQADHAEPLSLKLTVSQFFGAINWEGNHAIATPINSELTFIKDRLAIDILPNDDGFTLDDFSNLF
jgi:hypothetical protein